MNTKKRLNELEIRVHNLESYSDEFQPGKVLVGGFLETMGEPGFAQSPEEKNTVTIPKTEYDTLIEDQKFLEALSTAGVYGWKGYEDALEICYGLRASTDGRVMTLFKKYVMGMIK